MLKNEYDIDTKNFKCNENKKNWVNLCLQFEIYHSLNDFIQKNKNLDCFENCFDEIFHDFISWFLYDLKIGKNDRVTMLKFDDYFVIYTKNKKYEFVFYD